MLLTVYLAQVEVTSWIIWNLPSTSWSYSLNHFDPFNRINNWITNYWIGTCLVVYAFIILDDVDINYPKWTFDGIEDKKIEKVTSYKHVLMKMSEHLWTRVFLWAGPLLTCESFVSWICFLLTQEFIIFDSRCQQTKYEDEEKEKNCHFKSCKK